jgi:tetratricopeptide (TPR) repeat protein
MNFTRRGEGRWSIAYALAVVALAAMGAASLGASPAVAQDASADVAVGRDDEARAIFQAGRDAYARGEYAEALVAFRNAYELSGRAELQFNIGQAADRLRHDREAVSAFEAYLQAVPDASNRVEVEARLRVLRSEIARDDALRAQALAGSGQTPASDPPIVEQWWFWTLIGVAAVGAGVGIGFAVGSREELAPPTPGDLGPGGVIMALEGL